MKKPFTVKVYSDCDYPIGMFAQPWFDAYSELMTLKEAKTLIEDLTKAVKKLESKKKS